MSKRVVVIGAVALGPKAACRAKRVDPSIEITMIDRDEIISYGGCGIPYFVSGDVADIDGLRSTSAHVIRDSSFFRNAKGVDVLTLTEAINIDRDAKTVRVRDLKNGIEKDLEYDNLVLATGASPIVPPLEGVDLPGVSVVAIPKQAEDIKNRISKGHVDRAVVIGGGAIGIEMAEALSDLWDIDTTLVEMADQLLPTAFGREMSLILKNHMEEKGIRVLLSERVTRITGDPVTGVRGVDIGQGEIPCDLVILSVGIRPNGGLASDAGLDIGPCGGVLVDRYMRTSDPDIYAGGDCVEIPHLVGNESVHMPLGSLANRQGRVIGTNITGGSAEFNGSVGTFCIKVFDLGAARAGITCDQALKAGFDPVYSVCAQADRAHFYPTQELMYMKLIADRKTRQVLGIEAIGYNGDAVKARVDAVAVLLPHKVLLDEICNLETAYSPPLGSAMDIINNAANTLENIMEGWNIPVDVIDFIPEFEKGGIRVLDVRSAAQSAPFVDKFGKDRWQNIPQEELARRIDEVNNGEDQLYLVCGTGPRSYEAHLLLREKGITDTRNVQGGMGIIKVSFPGFAPEK